MGGGRYPFLVFVNFLAYCMIRVSEGKVHLGILIDSLERYRSLFYAALLLVSFILSFLFYRTAPMNGLL